jgi:hypothetical protein
MFIKLVLLFVLIVSGAFANVNYGKFTDSDIVEWNSVEGQNLLISSKFYGDFYNLAHFYQPQQNPLYCGIATTAIILNAFKQGTGEIENSSSVVKRPDDLGGGVASFKSYIQDDILNEKTDKIKESDVIDFIKKDPKLKAYDPGLTLKQLAKIIKSYGLDVDVNYAKSNKGGSRFKKILKKNLNEKDRYIIANFHGKTYGARTGGHISAIVAYNELYNKILILDVAAHKQPWHWVDVDRFYVAMQKKDREKVRGYLVVGERR